MFEFKSVELMNWAFWPTMRLPLDVQTIMISGPNGSGKTTFLDALRTLLRAPRLSANRRFTDYLVPDIDTAVVKGVVTNDVKPYRERRPFEYKGYTTDEVTLAILMRRRAGRWERRFAILEGDVPLTDLKTLRQSELISPESFTYEIGEAGFSAAFLKVLALEQGQTDKLCEKSPKELLDLLLDVHGDKEVIERYKDARQNYQTAHLEFVQLAARLAEEQARLLSTQRAAQEYQRYRRLTEELSQFEELLIPQAEYKQAQQELEQAQLEIQDLNVKLRPLDRDLIEIEQFLADGEAELERRKSEVVRAQGQREDLEQEERELDLRLNSLLEERRRHEATLRHVEGASREDPEDLRHQRQEVQRDLLRHELDQERLQERVSDAERALRSLEGPRRRLYPRFVEEFRQALDDAGIEHSLLCDIVEITDPSWQLAIESILGRDRFTVLVEAADQLAARRLGERLRYRCYVASWEADEPPLRASGHRAASQHVQFSEVGVPGWIVASLDRTQLVEDVQEGMGLGRDSVSVTRAGYRQDRRGGVSIAVEQFYCGNLGQEARRGDLEAEYRAARQELNDCRSQLGQLRQQDEQLAERLRLQDQLVGASAAETRLAELQTEVTAANDRHKQALAARRQAEQVLIERLEELNHYERDFRDKERELAGRRDDQSEVLDQLRDLQERVKRLQTRSDELAERLGNEAVTEQALRDVAELDDLTPRYYAVRNLLEEFEDAPDETAVEIYKHHKIQYDRQRQVYEEHEAGLRSWENEYRLAREKYLVIVDHTIREYRKNVMALAELAGVQADVLLPNIEAYEEILEQAELVVRFGFDGKRLTEMSAASLSGGQRVVASLILLMSLATSGGINRGGFFIIDEPFAHLSLERIGDVSRFLEKTRCQFILTSPTTHNVNVFSAARLQLNFRIKPRDAQFAPLPTIIRR